jgi:hypothetical protein
VRAEGQSAAAWGDIADDFVTEFSRQMLVSLPRRDQRERGERYISGLLSVPGRKSMRAIATMFGGGAAEQSLHHFIGKSSWDWMPVRRALARHLDRTLLPHAWVVRPMAVVKTGAHTVGVEESFVPQLGRVVNSQQSYSVWMASEETSAPIQWRLVLSSGWLHDEPRRKRAEIPESATEEVPANCAVNAVMCTAGKWGLRRRPMVMDARVHDAAALAYTLTRRQTPFVLRIGGGTWLRPIGSVSIGQGQGVVQAQQLVDMVKTTGRPVNWADPRSGINRSAVVSGVKVVLPGQEEATELVLAGAWSGCERRAGELWLTNLTAVPTPMLLRLGRLTQRVEQDFGAIAAHVGVMDFEGRTFPGWHRHLTLAGVAHSAVALASNRHAEDLVPARLTA